MTHAAMIISPVCVEHAVIALGVNSLGEFIEYKADLCLLLKLQTEFQSGCTILYFHPKFMKVTVSPVFPNTRYPECFDLSVLWYLIMV